MDEMPQTNLEAMKESIYDLGKNILGIPDEQLLPMLDMLDNNSMGIYSLVNLMMSAIIKVGGSGGSGGSGQLSSFPMNFVDGKGKYLQCEEFDEICDVKRIQFTVTYSNQAKTETGGFNVGTYFRSSDCVEGILPCLYSDNNGSHTGVLKFDSDMNITLFPSETVTQLDGEITFEISGVLSIGTIEVA